MPEILDYLAEESGFLARRGSSWYWMADAYPAQDVSLDGGEADNVLVLDLETESAIGEVDRESSITTVHEGAIYQVQGVTWRVERFDHANRRAYVKPVDTDYFTEAQADTEVRVLRLEERAERRREEHPIADPWRPGTSGEVDDALPELPPERKRFPGGGRDARPPLGRHRHHDLGRRRAGGRRDRLVVVSALLLLRGHVRGGGAGRRWRRRSGSIDR